MDIYAILKQRLDVQFPDYVVQFKDVPEEDAVISINVFGVAREDFHGVKEFIFDLEDELSGEDLFIPICYTKQELIEHYPAMASEYVLKQKSLVKKETTAVFASAFASYGLSNCLCSQRPRGDMPGLDQFLLLPPIWSAGKNKAVDVPSVSAADESYALAA